MSKGKIIIASLGIIPAVLYVWGFWMNWRAAGLGLLGAILAHGLNRAYREES